MAGRLPPGADPQPNSTVYDGIETDTASGQPQPSILMLPQETTATHNSMMAMTQLTQSAAASLSMLLPPVLFASQLASAGLPLALSQAMGINIPALQQLQYGAAFSCQGLASATHAASSTLPSYLANTLTPVPAQAAPPAAPKLYCRLLSMDQDEHNLSPYQCLVRQQIELFEVTQFDLQDKSQGRNRPIILKQIGIRCRHCGRKPARQRGKGAVFFPSQLVGLYQTAQNMANKHLLEDCKDMPKSVREDLNRVRLKEKGSKTRKSAYGGGRHYWADCLRVLGVEETSDRRLVKRQGGGRCCG